MYTLILVVHVLISLVLVVAVLLQAGKGGGLATAFGGGGAQSIFGGRGAATFLSKATVVLGGLFFLTSLSLALMSTRTATSTRSLMQEEARRATSGAPARPTGTERPTPAPTQTTPQGGAPAGTQPPANPQQPQGTQPSTPQGGTSGSGTQSPPSGGR